VISALLLDSLGASPVIGINLLIPLSAYLDNFQELFCDRKQVTYFLHLPDLICPPLVASIPRLKESGPGFRRRNLELCFRCSIEGLFVKGLQESANGFCP